jgi:acetoin utilization deacetylase AcuC-like enzyme
MLAAYVTHGDCLLHEMGADHPECADRINAIHDHLLIKGLLDYMNVCEAPLATVEQIERAHSAAYIRELMAMAPDEGHRAVDPDTCMNRYTINAALRAAGAAVLATDLVLTGQAPSAFCCVRPPGHHAERASAMGFCFFNNVAVGIRHALDVHGLSRVALLDFDVHHGNGSEDILRGDSRILMCSTYEVDLYPFRKEEDDDDPMMINVGLSPRSGGKAFREAVASRWLPALQAFRPQMIFVSAGFDGHREDDMGNLGLIEADFGWVTRALMDVANAHCEGRVVSCLEGGYALSALGRSAAAHVKVLIGAD